MASREDKQRSEASSSHSQEPADEQNYDATMSTPLTFAAFKRQSKSTDAFFAKNVAKNLKPGRINPERPFSYGRLSRNHLQTRMALRTHDPNVFLRKNSASVL